MLKDTKLKAIIKYIKRFFKRLFVESTTYVISSSEILGTINKL